MEISSSEEDEEEDNDVVMVHSDHEDEEEGEGDVNNSGSHINDEMNQPDAQGRVLVNIGHPHDEPDIYLLPQIARVVKPHQVSRDSVSVECGDGRGHEPCSPNPQL